MIVQVLHSLCETQYLPKDDLNAERLTQLIATLFPQTESEDR